MSSSQIKTEYLPFTQQPGNRSLFREQNKNLFIQRLKIIPGRTRTINGRSVYIPLSNIKKTKGGKTRKLKRKTRKNKK